MPLGAEKRSQQFAEYMERFALTKEIRKGPNSPPVWAPEFTTCRPRASTAQIANLDKMVNFLNYAYGRCARGAVRLGRSHAMVNARGPTRKSLSPKILKCTRTQILRAVSLTSYTICIRIVSSHNRNCSIISLCINISAPRVLERVAAETPRGSCSIRSIYMLMFATGETAQK